MFELPVKDFKELTAIPAEYWIENRRRVANRIRELMGEDFKANSFVLMKGHELHFTIHDADTTSEQYPEPNFFYLFGVPQFHGLHGLLNLDSGEASLVARQLTENEEVFEGGLTPELSPKAFAADRIISEAELERELLAQCRGHLYLLKGKIWQNLAKPALFPWTDKFEVNDGALFQALGDCREIKSAVEQSIMREVVGLTCEGHKYMMQQVRAGMGEHQLSELFKLRCGLGGTSQLAYGTICGSGRNASILHYIVNSKSCLDGDLILCDVGVMGNGYCADVTTTFPVNGKFDEKQKQIYNACLRSQRESMAQVKPGASFVAIQRHSFRVIVEEMLGLGLLKGATAEELLQKRLFTLFMPHSLGHFLGLYTHDVGCCLHSDEDNCTVSSSVTECTSLKAGMVITVEPGIYFIRSIIDNHKKNPEKAKYIDFDLLEQYFYIGGVRIEDDVLVTETGYENLSIVPRTVEEIESFMAGK